MLFLDLANYTTVLSLYMKLHIDTHATCRSTTQEQAEIWALPMR